MALQLSARSVGLLEAFYSSLKPVHLVAYNIEVAPGGKFPAGVSELAFEFKLHDSPAQRLYPTYHGVYVNVLYLIKAEVERSMLNKNLKKTREFIVEEHTKGDEVAKKPVSFSITPDSLQNVRKGTAAKIPDFLFEGRLDSVICSVSEPLTGEITVKRSALPIRSIEIQLVRVETCSYAEVEAREATEVQSIELAAGDIVHEVAIPIHMVFPRLFTAPSVSTKSFSVSFEVNIIVLLGNNNLVTENHPLKLVQ